MKLNILMVIKAIVVFVYGIVFILIPKTGMSYYALDLNDGGALMTQFFGASFILLGIVLWSARNAARSEVTLQALLLAVFIGDLIGFVIALLSMLDGVMNALGWGNVILYLLLAIGFGYFRFAKQTES